MVRKRFGSKRKEQSGDLACLWKSLSVHLEGDPISSHSALQKAREKAKGMQGLALGHTGNRSKWLSQRLGPVRPDLLLVKGSARLASKKSVILYAWRRQVTVLPTAPVCSQFCTYFQIYSPCHLAVSFLATSPAYEVSFFPSSNRNLVHP